MTTRVIRYRTTPATADENEALIRAVFTELEAERPAGLRYTSVRLDDDTFIHTVDVDDSAADVLGSLDAFGRFQQGIGGRCAEQPVAVDASVVGSYGFDRR